MHLLHNKVGLVNVKQAKKLSTNIARFDVIVLSTNIGQIRDLTTTHKNLPVKLSEAFMIGSDEVAIHSRSEPCSTI